MPVSNSYGPSKLAWTGLALGIVVLFVGTLYGCSKFLTHEGKTLAQYFRLVGQGDASGACGLMDKYAKAKLMMGEQVRTCEAGITKIHAALSAADRSELVEDGPFIRGSRTDAGHKVLEVSGNPLHMAIVTLIERQGRELIYDWR